MQHGDTIYPKQYSIKFLTSMTEMSPESLTQRSAQCSRRSGVCCQEWNAMFSTLKLAEPTKLQLSSSCCEAVAVPSCQLLMLFQQPALQREAKQGIKDGLEFKLVSLLDSSEFVLRCWDSSSTPCNALRWVHKFPHAQEADAELVPTGVQEVLDIQLVHLGGWKLVSQCSIWSSLLSPIFLQLLSTTIGDTRRYSLESRRMSEFVWHPRWRHD